MHWSLEIKHPDGTEEFFVLKPKTCTLGYAEDCDLHVYEPSISNHHAVFSVCQDGHWWVEDLNSTNGTWVENIGIQYPLALSPGMKLLFGDVEATVVVTQKVPN